MGAGAQDPSGWVPKGECSWAVGTWALLFRAVAGIGLPGRSGLCPPPHPPLAHPPDCRQLGFHAPHTGGALGFCCASPHAAPPSRHPATSPCGMFHTQEKSSHPLGTCGTEFIFSQTQFLPVPRAAGGRAPMTGMLWDHLRNEVWSRFAPECLQPFPPESGLPFQPSGFGPPALFSWLGSRHLGPGLSCQPASVASATF